MKPTSENLSPLTLFYSDTFAFPLPDGHRFPLQKYSLLRQAIRQSDLNARVRMCSSPRASDEQLLRVHHPEYIDQVLSGTLAPDALRRIGFPWSPELVERSRRSVGGTIAACQAALETGLAMNLAGGTHHAHSCFGSGFCLFNDVAVAAREVQIHAGIRQILIVDCDVHQGDGTADIFSGDPTVFTFSIHGERNFPFRKSASDLDIGLPDGIGDEAYLAELHSAIDSIFERLCPDLVFYLAGADPFQDDTLGRMKLTKAGLSKRDELVLTACRERGIPLAITLSGGYARRIEDAVAIHFETVRLAVNALGRRPGDRGVEPQGLSDKI
jgi:acetoin utilization deacetylase AcuC-like enzyme